MSFKPTIVVHHADYFNKINTDDETQTTLHSHCRLKKEALLVVSKLEAGFKMIKCHDKLGNELRDWLVDDVYYTTQTKSKSDLILVKIDSGEAWFAIVSVKGTPFKFLMDSEANKSVMSSKRFMSILELFRPKL